MKRESWLAAAVLFAALLACRSGPSPTDWSPRSVQTAPDRIAEKAIAVGEDDLRDVREAGGVLLGTLTMDEGTSGDSMEDAVAVEAAERGGTHFVAAGSSTDTTHAGAWTVKNKYPRFNVYRVPTGGWSMLPPSLAPKKYR
jgi:hypothetical protein